MGGRAHGPCMRYGFVYRRELRFAETDMAGVGHFSDVITLVEEAWHSWLGKMGESVHPATAPEGAEKVGWPVVSVGCDFRQPLHFNEQITVTLAVERMGTRSIRLRFTIDGPRGESAHGHFAVVCATPGENGWQARAIPASMVRAMQS